MNNRILYLEGSSGISGDMTVSALLDLGVSAEELKKELEKLPLEGYRLVVGRTEKCGIDACAFYVELDAKKPQPLRDYPTISAMIEQSDLSDGVKKRALEIFRVLAQAEAKVHGTTVEQVHFHEVGAVDSILDIVGTAVCLEKLQAEKIAVGTLREGQGTVRCQHGIMPVPVPATAELIARYKIPVAFGAVQGEMITPTGAAIAAACGNCGLPEEFIIEKIGIGSGEKEFPHANILRAMWILPVKKERDTLQDPVWVLESNVDDCTGEQLGYVQERLMEEGALDVSFLPLLMKKSRPAYQIQVICRDREREKLEELLFLETTTVGIRRFRGERTVLKRTMETIDTPYGKIRVKVCRLGEEVRGYPEYEDVKAAAKQCRVPFGRVFRETADCFGKEHTL